MRRLAADWVGNGKQGTGESDGVDVRVCVCACVWREGERRGLSSKDILYDEEESNDANTEEEE